MAQRRPPSDKAKILDFEVEREDFNVYRLEDGTIIKVKVSLANARVYVDEKGNPILNRDGNPHYDFHFETKVRI
ncbi:MAG: hypothetical protein DRJ31_10350, partial [Candidatus Methanomethylicota archaeon]